MKIIVFDVAAETGGALSILNKFYKEAFKKTEYEWHFILSTPILSSKNNVYVHNFPWIKNSWYHRLFFDLFIAPKLITNLKGDKILSLQNLVIPFTKKKQAIYFHQVLPFSDKHFKLKENPKLWVYQNILKKFIVYSFKKSNKIIVQANWIKKNLIEKHNIPSEKVIVQIPHLNKKIEKKYKEKSQIDKKMYFYPAAGAIYKNHTLIVEAVKKLVLDGIDNFEVIFTLSGNENSYINHIANIITKNKLPIKMIGKLSSDEVFEMYTKSILIFPSYIESYGLPLLEAKLHETPILVSNLEYSKEVLNNYDRVRYFDPYDSDSLYNVLKMTIKSKI